MDDVTLILDGQRFDGWESVAITRSMERGPYEFELQLTNRWRDATFRRIKAGQSVRLMIDNDLVVTGDIDDVMPDYDAEHATLTVAGRSRLGDLVDCSTLGRTFNGQRLDAIARAILAPFSIDLIIDASTDIGAPFTSIAMDDGQSPWEFLDRLARIRGVRLLGDAEGRLVVSGPGERLAETALTLGRNAVSARGQFTYRSRFNEYIVVGRNGDIDLEDASGIANVQARASDARVGRYRPVVIVSDDDGPQRDCQAQADWRRNTEYGRSQQIVYTVRGWREKTGGQIWTPNTRVQINDPYMDLEEERLLVEVRLVLDGSGRRSELMVMPREAMLREPLHEPEVEAEDA